MRVKKRLIIRTVLLNALSNEFFKFFNVGIANTIIGASGFNILIFFEAETSTALFCSWLIATVVSYILSKYYVFKTNGNHFDGSEIMKFVFTAFSYLAGYYVVITMLEGRLGAVLSYLFAIPLLFVLRFIMSKYWVFTLSQR